MAVIFFPGTRLARVIFVFFFKFLGSFRTQPFLFVWPAEGFYRFPYRIYLFYDSASAATSGGTLDAWHPTGGPVQIDFRLRNKWIIL